jgi:hypothetical protein
MLYLICNNYIDISVITVALCLRSTKKNTNKDCNLSFTLFDFASHQKYRNVVSPHPPPISKMFFPEQTKIPSNLL